MKLLLDENLPEELRLELPEHEVFTVGYLKWKGTKNGALLARAAAEGFDALLSLDGGLPFQQSLKTLPLSIILPVAPTNRIEDLRPLLPRLLAALQCLQPRTSIKI